MTELIALLTPIALMDSISIIPLCIVMLVVLLGGPNPLFRSAALITGIFVTYLAFGLLVLFGLQQVFDWVNAYALRVWKDPYTEELIFQIVIGLALVGFGLRIVIARKNESQNEELTATTAWQAFITGAGLTIVGLPGAVPYLAAIDLILRSDLPFAQSVLALVVYSIAFVAPLVALVVLSLVSGARSQRLLIVVKDFFDRWGQRLVIGLMFVLGTVLVLDGVGWFLGSPLIPV